jgi:hypothetical protein
MRLDTFVSLFLNVADFFLTFPNSILLTKPFAPAQLVTAVSQILIAIPPTT